ncbi:MAG: hypothetical protein ACYTG2_01230 [Planctomycetota bacterium]|jgi:hypothetical protein
MLPALRLEALGERGYEPRAYSTAMAELIASVPFVGLDAGHPLPRAAFIDTNHLSPEGTKIVSRQFAKRALLPVLH